jgi:signal transduction histidine kinase
MERHLKNLELTGELQGFIEAVNAAYHNHDKDRLMLERSLNLSSKEYNESMDKVRTLQSQLIHQEKMAGIGQLSAGVAHEINNPLGYTQSNMETLKRYLEKIKAFLDEVERLEAVASASQEDAFDFSDAVAAVLAAKKKNKIAYVTEDIDAIIEESLNGLQRMGKIVRNLLGFARAGIDGVDEEYDINKGIADTLAIVQNEIKYLARVEEDYGSVSRIKVTDGAINQVLLNLLLNALHAIKETGVEGVITVKTFEQEGQVCCSIADTGVGIPQKNIDHIFTPFFTTKPVGSGTGLGLSIAYDIIVNKHGGNIGVVSEVGKGTIFTIKLPIQKQQEN